VSAAAKRPRSDAPRDAVRRLAWLGDRARVGERDVHCWIDAVLIGSSLRRFPHGCSAAARRGGVVTVRAVIITGPGFQDEEYVYPYYRLLEAGYDVQVATKDGVEVKGKYGVPARATMKTTELDSKTFDLVLLPGGFEAPDRVRLLPEVIAFIREMDLAGKLIAAICHGPWILITAGICRGRKMTAFWSLEADLRNAGADYHHRVPVVVDGHLITSPHYQNNPEFMRAVIEWMTGDASRPAAAHAHGRE
jgi:protease I